MPDTRTNCTNDYTHTYTGGWYTSYPIIASNTNNYIHTYWNREPLFFRYAEPPIRMVTENWHYGQNPLWEFATPIKKRVIDDWWDIWGEILYD